MAAATEDGAGGWPTAGVVTVAAGPLGPLAAQAARAKPQITRPRPVRMGIVIPFQACLGRLGRSQFTRASGQPVGWSVPHAAPDTRRRAGRRRCRSAGRAGYRT